MAYVLVETELAKEPKESTNPTVSTQDQVRVVIPGALATENNLVCRIFTREEEARGRRVFGFDPGSDLLQGSPRKIRRPGVTKQSVILPSGLSAVMHGTVVN